MTITHRELREKLSDMAKNVPKSQKSTELTEAKIVRVGDRKHMYIKWANAIFRKVAKCFSKFTTRCH